MGKMGTIFGLVAAILAITAAALSFLISGKRAVYEERAGKLADAVAKMVDKLDANSGTDVKSAVNYTIADKAAGTAEDGSLAWKKYTEDAAAFSTNLDNAVALAGKLNQQRDSLAEAMGKAAAALEMDPADSDPAKLRDLSNEATFGAALSAVGGHVEAVTARDKAMVAALVRASESLSHPIDQGVFNKREETTDADGKAVKGQFACAAPLDDFTGNVKGVVTRCNDYAEAIVTGIRSVSKFTWHADAEKVKDEREYSGVLTSLQNDFTEINEQLALFEQAKKEVAEQKTRISQLTDELENTAGELKDNKKELAKAKSKIKQLEIALGGSLEDGTVDPNLTGQIVQVNDEWNFVVVNVGRTQRVQENLKMLVARDDKLVARLQLSKVLGKVSVAEILPEANVDAVRVGDRVIMPKSQDKQTE